MAFKKEHINPYILYLVGFIVSLSIALLVNVYFKNIDKEKNNFIQIIDKSSDNIHIIGSNCSIVEASETFAKTLGYTKKEILNMDVSLWETIPDYISLYNLENFKKPLTFYSKYKRKDNTTFDVLVNLTPIDLNDKIFISASIRPCMENKTRK